jgi:hypothetical protein
LGRVRPNRLLQRVIEKEDIFIFRVGLLLPFLKSVKRDRLDECR